jgi:SAM-dependent methyltransferase
MVRKPHASLDPRKRLPKAEKIRHLLELAQGDDALKLLEIGTGSGVIAHYFAVRSGLHCDVDAVDVLDQRQVFEGYRFHLVDNVTLPFGSGVFDVVISNHVLEHVGDRIEQQRHLDEMARVLKPGGRAYLASPNRWQWVEPHYRLLFLSWLPRRWRTPYLRWRQPGAVYDCEPLQLRELETMLEQTGLTFRNACVSAIRQMLATEPHPSLVLRIAGCLPETMLSWLCPICPTHVYLLHRKRIGP